MTSSRAGSLLLPAVSDSISMPLALARATLPPFHHFGQPDHRPYRRLECRLVRGIGGGRIECNARPPPGILDGAAEFLESEAAVRPAKQIDAAIVIGVLDAVEHHPRLVDAPGHRQ